MQKSVLRDALLLAAAAALGWLVHGTNTIVQAQHSSSSSARDGGNLGFQINGAGRDATLSLYNPESHMLYVYPTSIGNGRINCEYRFHIDRPGAAIERQNCEIGSAF